MVLSKQKAPSLSEPLPVPKFQVPDELKMIQHDRHDSRYELWSIRVPIDFNPKDLNGTTITIPLTSKKSSSSKMPLYPVKGTSFALLEGNAMEVDSVRILIPKEEEEDNTENSDSSDSETAPPSKTKYTTNAMVPLSTPLHRHFKVIPQPPEPDEKEKKDAIHVPLGTQYEGILSTLSNPLKKIMRVAYAPKDQVKGLKRRWTPIGGNANTAAAAVVAKPSSNSNSDSNKRRRVSFGANEVKVLDKNNHSFMELNEDDQHSTTSSTAASGPSSSPADENVQVKVKKEKKKKKDKKTKKKMDK